MKIYTLCGSMRFEKEMKEIAYFLETQKGYTILQCIYVSDGNEATLDELQKLELDHYHKIDINGTACTGKPTMLTNSKTNINKSYLYRGTFY